MLAQTCPDFEMLLVDNGAGTGTTVLGELGQDARIRCIKLDAKRGIAAGRNAAIAQAHGEFIAFLDYDDLARPRRLERQVSYLREHPQSGLVCSQVETIDERGRVTGRHFALLDPRAQREFSRFTMPAPLSSYLARRELCLRVPFRTEYDSAEDYDFFTRAVEISAPAGIPEVLAAYRRHAGQTTQEQGARQVYCAARARLSTARRRAGRAEGGPVILAGAGSDAPPAPAETYRAFAEQALQEGFGELAVYHARKLLSVRWADWPTALALVQRAVRLEPRRARAHFRLFLTGPLRTLGIKVD